MTEPRVPDPTRMLRALEVALADVESQREFILQRIREIRANPAPNGVPKTDPAVDYSIMEPGEAVYKYLEAHDGGPLPYRELLEGLLAGGLPMLTRVTRGNTGRSIAKERMRLLRITIGNNSHWLETDEREETVALKKDAGPYQRRRDAH